MALRYFIVDTETTGLDPKQHEIIEISIIDCDSLKQISRNIKAKYPNRANPASLNIIKKSYLDISQGDDIEAVIDQVNNFLNKDGLTPEHRCMIAHSAAFDRNFIHKTWNDYKKKFPVVCWLDTKAIARAWFKKNGILKPKLTLESALTLVPSAKYSGQHNAVSDARNLFLFWKACLSSNIDYIDFIKRWPQNKEKNENYDEQII